MDGKRRIRIGSARDGSVTAFIPDPVEKATTTSAAEGVAADASGNIYGGGSRREADHEICETVRADARGSWEVLGLFLARPPSVNRTYQLRGRPRRKVPGQGVGVQ